MNVMIEWVYRSPEKMWSQVRGKQGVVEAAEPLPAAALGLAGAWPMSASLLETAGPSCVCSLQPCPKSSIRAGRCLPPLAGGLWFPKMTAAAPRSQLPAPSSHPPAPSSQVALLAFPRHPLFFPVSSLGLCSCCSRCQADPSQHPETPFLHGWLSRMTQVSD